MAEAFKARDKVITAMSAAQQELGKAWQAAMQANPMTADVPVFQRIQGMQKELGAMMMEVSKIRGLG